MKFRAEELPVFLSLFERTAEQIRRFPGCSRLELWQDTGDPGLCFTYSWWESQQHLDEYRQSDLFRTTWAQAKILFEDKPIARSVQVLYELP